MQRGILLLVARKTAVLSDGGFDVDPAGFAPASSGTNSDMLLHTLRAHRVHGDIIAEKEKPPSTKRASLWYPMITARNVQAISVLWAV